ncbi:MAG: protein kinase [Gemmatimonadetes bacterium]|nr:protein kinase [Gemmatimonadota bacterium]
MPDPIDPLTHRLFADRFEVERPLARGGSATVYLAVERKHGRAVAVKVLHPEVAASIGTERFLREIGIVAQLSHPHVVPLIDSGESDGLLYYVIPFVPDGSLRDRLARESRLSLADALRVTEEVGAALDFAHRRGIIHRDVKPENILIADGHALLADFGIARARAGVAAGDPSADHARSAAVSVPGLAIGTPSYMSPEQAAGESNLGAASDIYSLACVVYEMLAGEPPFHGGDARTLMQRHVIETPPPVRSLRPDVPPAVEAVLARALAKDPAHRPQSSGEFVRVFREAAEDADRGTTAHGRARTVAVLPFVNASGDAENEYLSDGITDELIDALSHVDGVRVCSRTSVYALKGRALDVRAIGSLLGVSVVLEGTVRRVGRQLRVTAQLTTTGDGRLLWSQRFDRELDDVLAMQDEIARTIVTTLRATWLTDLSEPAPRRGTTRPEAHRAYLRGRWALNKRTREGTYEAIAEFEAAIADDPQFALAYTGLADAYALHVDYRSIPAAEGLEQAAIYAREALRLDDSLAEAHTSLAWYQFIYAWDWAAAEGSFRRAQQLDPLYATAHQWHAMLLAARGRHEESLVEAHTAQELDTGSVSVRRSLGWAYYYARRFDRTRHHVERAIEMNPTSEESFRMLGLALAIDGRTRDAVDVLREAYGMDGAGSYTEATLAYALARHGERAEAEVLLDRLVTRSATEYVSPAATATALLGLDRREEAVAQIEAAHAERRGWVCYLAVNPIFDPVRRLPRFAALEAAMGLRAPLRPSPR